jgi:hypothetical protein
VKVYLADGGLARACAGLCALRGRCVAAYASRPRWRRAEVLPLSADKDADRVSTASPRSEDSLSKLVGPTGNAPASVAYQAAALLLSYGPMAEGGELASQPAGPVRSISRRRPGFSGSPSKNGGERWSCSTAGVQPTQRVSNTCRASPGSLSNGGRWRSRSPATSRSPFPLQTGARSLRIRLPKVSTGGVAPPSGRLEDGCLICSRHAEENGGPGGIDSRSRARGVAPRLRRAGRPTGLPHPH